MGFALRDGRASEIAMQPMRFLERTSLLKRQLLVTVTVIDSEESESEEGRSEEDGEEQGNEEENEEEEREESDNGGRTVEEMRFTLSLLPIEQLALICQVGGEDVSCVILLVKGCIVRASSEFQWFSFRKRAQNICHLT